MRSSRFVWLAFLSILIGGPVSAAVLTLSNLSGTIVVETNDQNVQVVVKKNGQQVELADSKTGWKIRIEEGKYVVESKGSQDVFTLKLHAITVRRGKKVTVRVKLSTAKKAKSDGKSGIKKLRNLGAKVIERNGKVVEVFLANSPAKNADLAVLATLRHLESLTIIGCRNVSDSGLAYLRQLTRLRTVNLAPSQTTNDGLKHLKGLSNLTILGLNGTRVSSDGLKHLVNHSKLSVLYLSGTRVGDRGLDYLEQMNRIRWLDLSGTRVTANGLAKLRHMTDLRTLHLNRTQVAGVTHLSPLTRLESLDLSHTQVDDKAVVTLSKLINLKTLILLDTLVTKTGKVSLQRALPKCKIRYQARIGPLFTR